MNLKLRKEIPELDDILKLNKFQLKKVDHNKIQDIKNRISNSKHLIKEGAHYYMVQNFQEAWILLDPLKNLPSVINNPKKFWCNVY